MIPPAQLSVSVEKQYLSCFSVRISGNAASDKNIKDGVCAQIEKNFAKAKWKVSILLWTLLHIIITYSTKSTRS